MRKIVDVLRESDIAGWQGLLKASLQSRTRLGLREGRVVGTHCYERRN